MAQRRLAGRKVGPSAASKGARGKHKGLHEGRTRGKRHEGIANDVRAVRASRLLDTGGFNGNVDRAAAVFSNRNTYVFVGSDDWEPRRLAQNVKADAIVRDGVETLDVAGAAPRDDHRGLLGRHIYPEAVLRVSTQNDRRYLTNFPLIASAFAIVG